VADAVASLPARLAAHLDGVRIAIEDVPPVQPRGAADEIPLSGYDVAPSAGQGGGDASLPDRLVLYRRPLEARAISHHDLADLVRQTLMVQIARQAGIDDDFGEFG
jgi:predicted Zn-dependent protease with MMP-like domain